MKKTTKLELWCKDLGEESSEYELITGDESLSMDTAIQQATILDLNPNWMVVIRRTTHETFTIEQAKDLQEKK